MHKPSIRVDPFKKVSVNGIKVRLSRSVLGGLEEAGRGLVVFGGVLEVVEALEVGFEVFLACFGFVEVGLGVVRKRW